MTDHPLFTIVIPRRLMRSAPQFGPSRAPENHSALPTSVSREVAPSGQTWALCADHIRLALQDADDGAEDAPRLFLRVESVDFSQCVSDRLDHRLVDVAPFGELGNDDSDRCRAFLANAVHQRRLPE